MEEHTMNNIRNEKSRAKRASESEEGKKARQRIRNERDKLKGPIDKHSSKLYKHVTKHPKKYIAGATAVAGAGVYSEHQKQKKMGTHKKLRKVLKQKGYL